MLDPITLIIIGASLMLVIGTCVYHAKKLICCCL